MSDADTTSVGITVSALVPVSGKGEIRYVASVALDIGGVELVLDGWTLRMGRDGKMRVHVPAFRHPCTGQWAACAGLPPDLLRAVGEALLSEVPGGTMMVRLAGAALGPA